MRYIHRGREVGDKDEAGAICGVAGSTYHYYVRRLGAPGAIEYRAPKTNAMLYDLDKVREWHEGRPGSGTRSDLQPPSKRHRTHRAPRRVSVPLTVDQIRLLDAMIDPDVEHSPTDDERAMLDQTRSVFGVALRTVEQEA